MATYDIERCRLIEDNQLYKLNKLIKFLLVSKSKFYLDRKYNLQNYNSIKELKELPFLSKKDIILDQIQNPPFGTIQTLPLDTYRRTHQTSGTTQKPLKWLDSSADWAWWKRCWSYVYQAAGFKAGDVIFFPFTFNFFIGFWSAYDAAQSYGMRVIAGGGQDSLTRLNTIREYAPNGLITTPSYCFRLIEKAYQENIKLKDFSVSKIIIAGEPGGSLSGTIAQISEAWSCETFDHYGCTELGAMGYQCKEFKNGFHLNEDEFIFEVVNPDTLEPTQEGEEGELIVTNLGRFGSPLLRYRTGDLVRLSSKVCPCGRIHVRCIGGILGRTDDLIVIKGTNIYPSAIEAVLRNYPEIQEFQCLLQPTLLKSKILLKLEIKEESVDFLSTIKKNLKQTFHVTFSIQVVPKYSLPRFEGKSKRFLIVH